MNIDWSDAPFWANWAAMDDDGRWWWHEFEPSFSKGEWVCSGRYKELGIYGCNLIQRPVDD